MTKQSHRAPLHLAATKILESCAGLAADDNDAIAKNSYESILDHMGVITPPAADPDELEESLEPELDSDGHLTGELIPVGPRESMRRRELRESRAIANSDASRANGIPEKIVLHCTDGSW